FVETEREHSSIRRRCRIEREDERRCMERSACRRNDPRQDMLEALAGYEIRNGLLQRLQLRGEDPNPLFEIRRLATGVVRPTNAQHARGVAVTLAVFLDDVGAETEQHGNVLEEPPRPCAVLAERFKPVDELQVDDPLAIATRTAVDLDDRVEAGAPR